MRNWRVEPQDMEPGPPNREDACMVCDRIDCVCTPDFELVQVPFDFKAWLEATE